MNRARIGFTAAVLGSFALLGCQNKTYQENLALHKQNRELQAQQGDMASLQSQIAERDAKIQDLQSQLRQPQAQPPGAPATETATASDLAGIEVTRDVKAGTVTVNLPGDVLFTPGRA